MLTRTVTCFFGSHGDFRHCFGKCPLTKFVAINIQTARNGHSPLIFCVELCIFSNSVLTRMCYRRFCGVYVRTKPMKLIKVGSGSS